MSHDGGWKKEKDWIGRVGSLFQWETGLACRYGGGFEEENDKMQMGVINCS